MYRFKMPNGKYAWVEEEGVHEFLRYYPNAVQVFNYQLPDGRKAEVQAAGQKEFLKQFPDAKPYLKMSQKTYQSILKGRRDRGEMTQEEYSDALKPPDMPTKLKFLEEAGFRDAGRAGKNKIQGAIPPEIQNYGIFSGTAVGRYSEKQSNLNKIASDAYKEEAYKQYEKLFSIEEELDNLKKIGSENSDKYKSLLNQRNELNAELQPNNAAGNPIKMNVLKEAETTLRVRRVAKNMQEAQHVLNVSTDPVVRKAAKENLEHQQGLMGVLTTGYSGREDRAMQAGVNTAESLPAVFKWPLAFVSSVADIFGLGRIRDIWALAPHVMSLFSPDDTQAFHKWTGTQALDNALTALQMFNTGLFQQEKMDWSGWSWVDYAVTTTLASAPYMLATMINPIVGGGIMFTDMYGKNVSESVRKYGSYTAVPDYVMINNMLKTTLEMAIELTSDSAQIALIKGAGKALGGAGTRAAIKSIMSRGGESFWRFAGNMALGGLTEGVEEWLQGMSNYYLDRAFGEVEARPLAELLKEWGNAFAVGAFGGLLWGGIGGAVQSRADAKNFKMLQERAAKGDRYASDLMKSRKLILDGKFNEAMDIVAPYFDTLDDIARNKEMVNPLVFSPEIVNEMNRQRDALVRAGVEKHPYTDAVFAQYPNLKTLSDEARMGMTVEAALERPEVYLDTKKLQETAQQEMQDTRTAAEDKAADVLEDIDETSSTPAPAPTPTPDIVETKVEPEKAKPKDYKFQREIPQTLKEIETEIEVVRALMEMPNRKNASFENPDGTKGKEALSARLERLEARRDSLVEAEQSKAKPVSQMSLSELHNEYASYKGKELKSQRALDIQAELKSREAEMGKAKPGTANAEIERKDPVNTGSLVKRVLGKVVEVVTGKMTPMKVRYALVDREHLVASHTANYTENKAYPQELQNRSRTSDRMKDSVEKIVGKPRSNLLLHNEVGAEGRPIIYVDKQGRPVVISGNGRVMALNLMAERQQTEKIAEYEKTVREHLSDFGIEDQDVSGKVLVAVYYGDGNVVDLAMELNESHQKKLTEAEQAMTDARVLQQSAEAGDDIFVLLRGDANELMDAKNEKFIDAFIEKCIDDKNDVMVGGQYTDSLQRRIENALFMYLFNQDAHAQQLLETFRQTGDSRIKWIMNGLIASMPEIAKLNAMVQKYGLANYDIMSDLLAALVHIDDLRRRGIDVFDAFQEQDIFNENQEYIPSGKQPLYKALYEIRSNKSAFMFIAGYYSNVSDIVDPEQVTLFSEGKKPSKQELFDNYLKEWNDEQTRKASAKAEAKESVEGTGREIRKESKPGEPSRTREIEEGTQAETREQSRLTDSLLRNRRIAAEMGFDENLLNQMLDKLTPGRQRQVTAKLLQAHAMRQTAAAMDTQTKSQQVRKERMLNIAANLELEAANLYADDTDTSAFREMLSNRKVQPTAARTDLPIARKTEAVNVIKGILTKAGILENYTENDDGAITMTTKDGTTLTMNVTEGEMTVGGKKRAGYMTHEYKGDFLSAMIGIAEAYNQGNMTTYHEFFHFAWQALLSNEQRSKLLDYYEQQSGIGRYANPVNLEEYIADSFMGYAMMAEHKPTSAIKRIFNYLADAIYKIRRAVLFSEAEHRIGDVFKGLLEGDVTTAEQIKPGEQPVVEGMYRTAETQTKEVEKNVSPQTDEGYAPKKVLTAYKLFETKKTRPGEIFPLFIGSKEAVPVGKWIRAEFIPTQGFAERPGWHLGFLPLAPHLRKKSTGLMEASRVWYEVQIPDDVNWQERADASPTKDIRNEVPEGGYYSYPRPAAQGGEWKIAGAIKVIRPLSHAEVIEIRQKAGVTDTRYRDVPSAMETAAAEQQLQAVRKQYEGTEQWLKAPNGKATNLTEHQWLQVRTPNFIEWFGDWINSPETASKVVDENGEPRAVWHGTKEGGFTVFDKEKLGSNTKSPSAFKGHFFAGKESTSASVAYVGDGALDTSSTLNSITEAVENAAAYATQMLSDADVSGYADGYSEDLGLDIREAAYKYSGDHKGYERAIISLAENIESDLKHNTDDILEQGYSQSDIDDAIASLRQVGDIVADVRTDFSFGEPGESMYNVFLNVRNPVEHDYFGASRGKSFNEIIDAGSKTGSDGAIFKRVRDGGDIDNIYVAFSPNQIKSAVDNVGTFSAETSDIRFRDIDADMEIARNGTDAERAALAGNPKLSAAAQEIIVYGENTGVATLFNLAQNPSISPRAQEALSTHEWSLVRDTLARNGDISHKTQDTLVRDRSASVRLNLAVNNNLSPSAQLRLASDTDVDVRAMLAANPSVLEEAQKILSQDEEIDVLTALAKNRNIVESVQEELTNKLEPIMKLAVNPSISEKVQLQIMESQFGVTSELAKNTNLTNKVREMIIASGYPHAIYNLAINRSTPAEMVMEAMADMSRADREYVVKNITSPDAQIYLFENGTGVDRIALARSVNLRSPEARAVVKPFAESLLEKTKSSGVYKVERINEFIKCGWANEIEDLRKFGLPAVVSHRSKSKLLYDVLNNNYLDDVYLKDLKKYADPNKLKKLVRDIYESDADDILNNKKKITKEDIRAKLDGQTDGFFTIAPQYRKGTQTISDYDYAVSMFADVPAIEMSEADRAEVSNRMLFEQTKEMHPSGYAFLLMNYIVEGTDGKLYASLDASDTVIITETQSDVAQPGGDGQDFTDNAEVNKALNEAAKKRREIWWEALVSDTVRNLLHQGVENVYIFDGETQRNFSGLNQKAAELFYDIKPRKVGFSSESKEIAIDGKNFKVRELSAEAKENMRFRDIHDSVAEAERQLQDVREKYQGTDWYKKLPNTDEFSAMNNVVDQPYTKKIKVGELYKDGIGDDPYIYRAQYVNPKDYIDKVHLEGETYEKVVAMPTTQKYIEWYKEGHEPPPVTLVEHYKIGLNPIQRRRWVAAVEAGVNKVPALVEIGRASEMAAHPDYMKAPNGQDTNLNEHQWLQVRTPSFKTWFGDWENDPTNASKVVDENGEPLVVYHGMGRYKEFSETFAFSKEKLGSSTGAASAKKAFFFAQSKGTSVEYAGMEHIIPPFRSWLDPANNVSEMLGDLRKTILETPAHLVPDTLWDAYANLVEQIYATDNLEERKAIIEEFASGDSDLFQDIVEHETDGDYRGQAIKFMMEDRGFFVEDFGNPEYDMALSEVINSEELYALERELEFEDKEGLLRLFNNYTVRDLSRMRNAPGVKSEDFAIVPIFLNMKNPLQNDFAFMGRQSGSFVSLLTDAEKSGSDGTIFKNVRDGGGYDNIFAVFEPNQIKSATANYGTFSAETNDIRYRNIEPTSLPPSAAARSVNDIKREGFTLINAVKNLAHIAETTRTAEGALFSLKDKQYHINALTGDISVLKDGEFATRGNLSSIGGLVKSYLAGDSISFVRGFGLVAELFLTDKQRQVLDSAYLNALDAANAFADYAITKDRGKLDSLAAPVFRSMALQTSNLMRKLTGRGLELSSRDIQQAAYLKRAAGLTTAERSLLDGAQELINGETRFRDLPSKEEIAEAERQLQAVRERYQGTERWMKAPNGQDTNLNEHQWLQVRTENFKKWFGDWENDPANASKVVDENGEPRVVYHGVSDWVLGRGRFNVKKLGKSTQAASAKEGFFFAGDKKTAARYPNLGLTDEARQFDERQYRVFMGAVSPVFEEIIKNNPDAKGYGVSIASLYEQFKKQKAIYYGRYMKHGKKRGAYLPWHKEHLTETVEHTLHHIESYYKREGIDVPYLPRGERKGREGVIEESSLPRGAKDAYHALYKIIEEINDFYKTKGKDAWGENPNAVLSVFLNIRDVFRHDYKGKKYREESYASNLRKAKQGGSDGALFLNTYDGAGKTDIAIVFEPNQIKSATDNRGTFSEETDHIRFRDIDDTSATALNNTASAFLNVRKLLDEVKSAELTGEQIEGKVKALIAKIKDKAPALSSSAIEEMLKGKDIKTKSGASAFLNELIGKSGGAAKRSVMDGLRRIFRDTKSSEAKVGGYPSQLLRYIEHVLSLAVDHEYDADGMITGQKHTLAMELELLTKQRDEFEAQMAMADSLTEAQITKITETLNELDDKIKILMQYGGLEQKNAYDNVMAYANAYRLWKEGKELLTEHRESKRAAAKETMTQVYALLGLSKLLSTAQREAMERSMSKLQKKIKGIKDAKDAIYLSHTLMESMFEQLDKIGYSNKDDLRSALMEMDTAVQELEAQVSAMAEGDPELLKAKAELHELKTKYSAVATAYNYVKDYQGDFSGYFQKRFFEPIVQATSAEYQSKQEVLRLIDETKRDIYKRVFGDSSFVSWAKFGMDYRNGVLTLDRKSGDTRVPTRYGYDEIAEIYAHSLREENLSAMDNTGWDSEVLDQIHKFLESEPIGRFIKEYVDWTVGSLFPMLYDRYAPAFEKKYGFALGKEEVYFPISRKIEVVPETVDVNEPYHDFNSSSMWLKYFIDRVETNRQFSNEFLGLTRKLNDYIESMEHFKAFAPVIDDAKYTIMRSDSKLILKRMMGQRWLEVLNTYYNDIARGQRARKAKWLEKWLNKFLFGAVVWNLMSGVKQTSSTILFAGEMKNVNLARFITGIARVLVHPAETYKIITSSPLIQKRLEHGYNMELYRALHEADVGTLRSAITQAMGKVSTVKWGDFLAVMIGGGSLYYNNYADYIKEGKTHEQAHEQALLDMDIAAARTQQSSEIFGVSELQAGIGKAGALKRLIASFKSQPIAILNSMVNTIMMSSGTGKSVATTAQQATITMLLYPLVYGILASGFITPDKDDPEGWLFMWFYRMLENFGVFGDYIQYIAGAARTGRASPYGMDLMPLTASIEETGQSIAQVAAKPARLQSWDGLLVNMSQTMGVPFRSTRNLYRGVEAFISEDDERFARLLGMSKGAADLYQKKLYRRRK